MSMDSNTNTYPTAGQIERSISQKVRSLYRQQFGHQPSRVNCHLLDRMVIISLEDTITPIERLLIEGDASTLVSSIRSFIEHTIKPKLKELVEEISQVNVVNCLYDTAVETGYAGAIVTLEQSPQIRRSKSSFKKAKSRAIASES